MTGKLYVGTKVVKAWLEDKDGQPGYGVEYKDGYRSWSPKVPFEEAYQPLESMLPVNDENEKSVDVSEGVPEG